MSYEGYIQVLCASGHLRQFDAYEDVELFASEDVCSCDYVFVFCHNVDETNCDGRRYPFEVATKEETEVCNLGHVHITKEVTYVIPEKGY